MEGWRRKKVDRAALVARQARVESVIYYIAGECELFKEGRNVLEETRKTDGCDVEKFGTSDREREKRSLF